MADQKAGDLLDRAEHAAIAGDFAVAEQLLRSAARIQEEELGSLHPDLANTLNNLAVVAERTGHPDEAETLYRRAAAIAVAAFSSDHPMVVASRQNLEDFCRAHGLSIDAPAVITPMRDIDREMKAPAAARSADTVTAGETAVPSSIPPRTDPGPPVPIASRPVPPAPTAGRPSRSLAGLAIGVVVLATAAVLLVIRPWSSPHTSMPVQTPTPAAALPAEAARPPLAASPTPPAPIGQAEPRTAAPRGNDRNVATKQPPAADGVIVATAQLCRTFSIGGGTWRCDQLGRSAAPGPVVYYTRVRSPRDTAVVHRWYRGDTLRQSVRLTIRANATEGFRTFSRQTVDSGEWRVEIRSTDGNLLHEERFAVR